MRATHPHSPKQENSSAGPLGGPHALAGVVLFGGGGGDAFDGGGSAFGGGGDCVTLVEALQPPPHDEQPANFICAPCCELHALSRSASGSDTCVEICVTNAYTAALHRQLGNCALELGPTAEATAEQHADDAAARQPASLGTSEFTDACTSASVHSAADAPAGGGGLGVALGGGGLGFVLGGGGLGVALGGGGDAGPPPLEEV
jgi:hypothetical protein